MKNRLCAIFIASLVSLLAGGACQAMSELVSLAFTPVWPDTSTPSGALVYEVTLTRDGQGRLNVTLGIEGLPEGATATFSPNVVSFTGQAIETKKATMTITCTGLIDVDAFPFTVTGEPRRQVVPVTNQLAAQPRIPPTGEPLLMLDLPSANNLRVRGLGASGASYGIEASPSLTNPSWTPVGSSTADGNGRFTFAAAQPAGSSSRFYRAVLLTPQP